MSSSPSVYQIYPTTTPPLNMESGSPAMSFTVAIFCCCSGTLPRSFAVLWRCGKSPSYFHSSDLRDGSSNVIGLLSVRKLWIRIPCPLIWCPLIWYLPGKPSHLPREAGRLKSQRPWNMTQVGCLFPLLCLILESCGVEMGGEVND